MSLQTFCAAAFFAVLAAGALSSSATRASASDAAWQSALDADCERCAPATDERHVAPFELPLRAISYSFTGEFAHGGKWRSIDLDTGAITKWEWLLVNGARQQKNCEEFEISSEIAPIPRLPIRVDIRSHKALQWTSNFLRAARLV